MPPAPKYAQVAAIVRAQVTDGTLRPGEAAPSGAQLARLTGFSVLTCRNGLRSLVREGVLSPGASPAARPRVTVPEGTRGDGPARALSRGLAARRHAAGLTQPGLSALTGFSVTTIGHAETGRLWQSREFWEETDLALAAGGELTRLHDAYRAGTAGRVSEEPPPACVPVPRRASLVRMTMHWSDGTVTTVCPPAPPPPYSPTKPSPPCPKSTPGKTATTTLPHLPPRPAPPLGTR
jgi:hypothetical protein